MSLNFHSHLIGLVIYTSKLESHWSRVANSNGRDIQLGNHMSPKRRIGKRR